MLLRLGYLAVLNAVAVLRIRPMSDRDKDVEILALLATQPSIPWRQVARVRDHLANRYFDTACAIWQATVDEDCPISGMPSGRWRVR